MKRATRRPQPERIEEALIIADVIAVGRRAEVEERIWPMVLEAMAEYMRVYKARKMNNDPWVEMPLLETRSEQRSGGSGYPKGGVSWSTSYEETWATGETDYQCFFCRKSLNTLPRHKLANKQFRMNLRLNHIDECGIRFLAGIGDPHPPLSHGKAGR